MAKAKKAEPRKEPTLSEKREELKKNSVTKKHEEIRIPAPKKLDSETKKQVRRVANEEAKKVDRDKPKRLSAETATNGLTQPVGIDMYTASLPTGMPAQSFSRSAAPKPFDVQVRPDGKLYVYSPVWNTHEVKLGSSSGAAAEKGKWNEVGTASDSSKSLYAVQEDALENGEVKSSAYYITFEPGKDSSTVRYTSVEVARKFDNLGWRPLASGALVTGGSSTAAAVGSVPLAWTVRKGTTCETGASVGGGWEIYSPLWVSGNVTVLPETAEEGKWTDLGVTSGTLYAVHKEESSIPGEGETADDVTWSFISLTLSNSEGVNVAPSAPVTGAGSSSTEGTAGIRFINVPIGKFENGGFTQYHEGVIVTGYSGGGSGGGEGGSSWGWGPLEWCETNSAFIQYKGTFDETGENFTCCDTSMRTVMKVIAHADDHTEGLL